MAANQYVFVSVSLSEKEQVTIEKKYEVYRRNEMLGHVYLTYDRDWLYDGIDKTGERALGSRGFAADRLFKYTHG